MKKAEVALMLRSQFDEKSKMELIQLFEKKAKRNGLILWIFGAAQVCFLLLGGIGGIIFWIFAIWFIGNQWYLMNQLRRFRNIEVRRMVDDSLSTELV